MIPTRKDPKGVTASPKTPKTGDAEVAPTHDSVDDGGGYFDFIEDQKSEYKDLLSKQAVAEPNGPLPKLPPTFEQVSICAKGGGCRYFFRIVAPVNAKVFDDKVPGGVRPAMATIRRCLVGAVKLESDNPIALSAMRGAVTEAPYGVQECSHWSPYTNEELQNLTERRLAGQERDRDAEEMVKARDAEEARSRKGAAPNVDDPGDEMDDGCDDEPEPDFNAPPKPIPEGLIRNEEGDDDDDGE